MVIKSISYLLSAVILLASAGLSQAHILYPVKIWIDVSNVNFQASRAYANSLTCIYFDSHGNTSVPTQGIDISVAGAQMMFYFDDPPRNSTEINWLKCYVKPWIQHDPPMIKRIECKNVSVGTHLDVAVELQAGTCTLYTK